MLDLFIVYSDLICNCRHPGGHIREQYASMDLRQWNDDERCFKTAVKHELPHDE